MVRVFATIVLVIGLAVASHGFTVQPKVLNGPACNTSDIPYFVGIYDAGEFECSASLLSDRWVLTAAHCLTPFSGYPSWIFVHVGIRSNGTYEMILKVHTSALHLHPNFAEYRPLYDIGLIELPYAVPLTQTIQPTKLPQTCDEIDMGENVYGIGAGETIRYEDFFDGIARQALFTTCPCEPMETLEAFGYRSSESIICSNTTSEIVIGHGDSGGPMVRQKDGVQFGIIRSILRSTDSTTLQIYTKIPYFFDWISEITGLDLPTC